MTEAMGRLKAKFTFTLADDSARVAETAAGVLKRVFGQPSKEQAIHKAIATNEYFKARV